MTIKTLGVTGHRPKSFTRSQWYWAVSELRQSILKAINNGFTSFRSGGAIGIDNAFNNIVLANKFNGYPDIELTIIRPFKGQIALWNENDKAIAQIHNQLATVIYAFDPPYDAWKMLERNKIIVDGIDAMIAVIAQNTNKGGTYHASTYSIKQNIPTLYIHPDTQTSI